jgi:DnaJ-class molecular chaperone
MAGSADQQVARQTQLELEAILRTPYQDVCNVCKGEGKITAMSKCPKCKGSGSRLLRLL